MSRERWAAVVLVLLVGVVFAYGEMQSHEADQERQRSDADAVGQEVSKTIFRDAARPATLDFEAAGAGESLRYVASWNRSGREYWVTIFPRRGDVNTTRMDWGMTGNTAVEPPLDHSKVREIIKSSTHTALHDFRCDGAVCQVEWWAGDLNGQLHLRVESDQWFIVRGCTTKEEASSRCL